MTQQSILTLAKQGDLRAIASVVDYILKDKNVKVRAYIKDNCLFLTLESSIPLEQISTINTIHKLLNNLAIPKLTTAKVQGKLEGISKAHWTEAINLATPVKSQLGRGAIAPPASTAPASQKLLPKQPESQSNNPSETAPKNKQASQNVFLRKSRWSPWFPYPSSWLRTLGLIIWLAIVVKITSYWAGLVGIVMATILDNPTPLFNALFLALVISVIIFAYSNHIVFGRNIPNFNSWRPSPISWWEGIYAPIVVITSSIIVLIIIIPFAPIVDCDFYQTEYLRFCIRNFERYDPNTIEILARISSIIWIFSVAYLYQIEFLVRENFSLQKLVRFLLTALTSFLIISLVSFTIRNPQPLQNLLQSYAPKSSPTPIVSNAVTNLTNPSASPTPVASISPATAPIASPVPADPFIMATENALQASKLVQVAKTKIEWQKVAEYWEAAITFMQVVPGYHPKYAIAQQKVKEYQSNLEYAKLAGSKAIS